MSNKELNKDRLSIDNGTLLDKIVFWLMALSLAGFAVVLIITLFLNTNNPLLKNVGLVFFLTLIVTSVYCRIMWMEIVIRNGVRQRVFKDKYSKEVEN